MYRTVYWHKEVRAATAMIKKALLSALAEGSLDKEALYGLDDASFFRLQESVGCPAFTLLGDVRDGRLLSLAAERPYSKDDPFDAKVSSLEGRMGQEALLFSKLSIQYPHLKPWEVVIDIPEPVSFESDMHFLFGFGTYLPIYPKVDLTSIYNDSASPKIQSYNVSGGLSFGSGSFSSKVIVLTHKGDCFPFVNSEFTENLVDTSYSSDM